MNIKNLIFWSMLILTITFCMSCAPSPDEAGYYNSNPGDNLFVGMLHGAELPFSIVGRFIFNLDVGLWDKSKIGDLTYIGGYLISVFFYGRIINFFWEAFKEQREFSKGK